MHHILKTVLKGVLNQEPWEDLNTGGADKDPNSFVA